MAKKSLWKGGDQRASGGRRAGTPPSVWAKIGAGLQIAAKLVAAYYTGGASTPLIDKMEKGIGSDPNATLGLTQKISQKPKFYAADVPDAPMPDLIATPVNGGGSATTLAGMVPATGADATLRGVALTNAPVLKTSPALAVLGLMALAAGILLAVCWRRIR
jgi:hypothetical protein